MTVIANSKLNNYISNKTVLIQLSLLLLSLVTTFILFHYFTFNPFFYLLIPFFISLFLVTVGLSLKNDKVQQTKTDKIKIDLVANISHEVRTPLTALKGYVQVLKSLNKNMTQEQLEFLNKIELNTERIAVLFRDILDLSILESNQKISFELLPLPEITEKIISSLSHVHQQKCIRITSDVKVDAIEGNGKTIEQLLNNLVDNAYKYTPKYGTIYISWKKIDNHALLMVKDTGIGITLEDRDRIFERFFRIDKSRSREMGGTGLGLAIVKHVVQRHDGRIWLESGPELGTTFFVQLPLKQAKSKYL